MLAALLLYIYAAGIPFCTVQRYLHNRANRCPGFSDFESCDAAYVLTWPVCNFQRVLDHTTPASVRNAFWRYVSSPIFEAAEKLMAVLDKLFTGPNAR